MFSFPVVGSAMATPLSRRWQAEHVKVRYASILTWGHGAHQLLEVHHATERRGRGATALLHLASFAPLRLETLALVNMSLSADVQVIPVHASAHKTEELDAEEISDTRPRH